MEPGSGEGFFGRLVEQQAGVDYAQYLIPEVLVMTTALAAGGPGVALAEDLQGGVVDRSRSLPMTRHALLDQQVGARRWC